MNIAARNRLYKRTEAGRQAWASAGSGLPAWYRSILGIVDRPMSTDEVLARVASPVKQVWSWLDELDTLGYLESEPFVTAVQLRKRFG